jgi:hypothetical protein
MEMNDKLTELIQQMKSSFGEDILAGFNKPGYSKEKLQELSSYLSSNEAGKICEDLQKFGIKIPEMVLSLSKSKIVSAIDEKIANM